MMLHRQEFLAAVFMVVILAIFGSKMGELEGESLILPSLLMGFMALVTLLQFALAIFRGKSDRNVFESVKKFPFLLVGKLVACTLAYVGTLLSLGFYVGSFIYMTVASLLANPEPVTVRIACVRAVVCGLFVLGLYLLFTVMLGVVIPRFSLW